MRKRPPLTLRQLLVCLLLLTTFTGSLWLFSSRVSPDRRFEQLSTQLFRDEMTASTLNMHYTIADPADFGIGEYEAVLPVYRAEDAAESQKHCEQLLQQLRRLDTSRLSPENAYTCQLLQRTLENQLVLSGYPYYNEPLSPGSGMQSQLPILLAEYTFRSVQDVEDYLELLAQVGDYFASLLTFEQEKTNAGFGMAASSLKKVCQQCDTIVTTEELTQGTHFLQTTFRERLEALQQNGDLDSGEIPALLAKNDRLLREVVQPAYAALAEGLHGTASGESDTSKLPIGLAAYPNGRDYYTALLFSETGSSRSIRELEELLLTKFKEEQDAIRTLAAQSPTLIYQLEDNSAQDFPLTDPRAILTDLQARMENDFPVISPVPPVTVKAVVPSLEPYSAPAFYLTTPLGDSDNNVIYINHSSTPQGLELYTTLAHEGFPGHLYQTVYRNRLFLEQDENPVRKLIWYGGYLEGWALYVEFLSYDYAADLLAAEGLSDAARISLLERHTRSLQLCLYSLLDLLIHGDGASYEQVCGILAKFGIDSPRTCEAIYTYIAEEPCNYPKYYIGYLEILELQKIARALWGADYSDLRFHTFYLEQGPADFASLEGQLQLFPAN